MCKLFIQKYFIFFRRVSQFGISSFEKFFLEGKAFVTGSTSLVPITFLDMALIDIGNEYEFGEGQAQL